jgi:hypothetical protein
MRILAVKRTSLSSGIIDPGSESLGKRVLPFIRESLVLYLSQIIIGHLGAFSFRSKFDVPFINLIISIISVPVTQIKALRTCLGSVERLSNCLSENRRSGMMWESYSWTIDFHDSRRDGSRV